MKFRSDLQQKFHSVDDQEFRMDWVATTWRPDPVSSEAREINIGKGYSTRRETINILLEALPIADQDSFCRLIIRPSFSVPLSTEWPETWTVLAYKNDRTGATRKTVLGTGWREDDEILVCLDALPTPNQNIECWIALKPKLGKIDETKAANFRPVD